MKVGIGLPANIPGAKADVILEWAQRADTGPFSSLGLIDRLVYDNYEPLIALAAAAGVTHRVRLMTTVLLAPLRNAGMLAKQAASLNAISRGRFTLGLGIGRREDDYRAAPAPFKNRGRRFEKQLDTMKRIWAGQGPSEGVGPVGPSAGNNGGPEVLIGGGTPQAISRVGPWADGYMAPGGDPATVQSLYQIAEDSWKAAGKSGSPRLVAVASYALGPNAADKVGGYIRHYYAFLGAPAEQMAQRAISSTEAVKGMISDMSGIGMDELVFLPATAEMDQLDRLADIVS